MSTGAWPTTAKLDAPRVLARIASIAGVEFELEGPCPGGEVGAAYVRWPDGRRSVLTSERTRSGRLTDLAREAGVPTARHELTAHVDGIRVIVQERLPGHPPSEVDAGIVAQMLAVNEKLAGVLAGEPAPRPAELYLTGDGPGFCLHEPLQSYSDRTRRLLDHVHQIGHEAGTQMVGDDLVHLDFHPGNVLVSGGRLSGVIDWDGATRGDRHFDLVTLRFWLCGTAPALVGPLDERLALISQRRRRQYWASNALRMVDWSIRHHDAAAVQRWLTVAESGL